MIFFNDIVILENIQRNNSLSRNIKALAISLLIYTTLVMAIIYISSKSAVLLKPEKTISISLSEFSSTSGDKKITDRPDIKKEISSHIIKPKTNKKVLKPKELKTPQKIPLHSPMVSSEELKPVVSPHIDTSSSTNSNNSDTKSESKDELSKNQNSSKKIGGATPEQIWNMIKNALKYPQIACKMKIEGVVVVFFILNPDGTVKTAKVKTSSGSDLLDDRAIQTIMKLNGRYPAPNKSLELSFPIAFSLNKS